MASPSLSCSPSAFAAACCEAACCEGHPPCGYGLHRRAQSGRIQYCPWGEVWGLRLTETGPPASLNATTQSHPRRMKRRCLRRTFWRYHFQNIQVTEKLKTSKKWSNADKYIVTNKHKANLSRSCGRALAAPQPSHCDLNLFCLGFKCPLGSWCTFRVQTDRVCAHSIHVGRSWGDKKTLTGMK